MFIQALTLRDLLTGIPHDAAAIVVYVLLLAGILAVIRGSVHRDPPASAGPAGGDLPHG
jgi:hypothetical protein